MAERKKKYRLFYQMIALMVLFYTLAAAIGLYSMYQSCTRTHLSAKNEVIERDLEVLRNELFTNEYFAEYPWLLEYCTTHREELLESKEVPYEEISDEYDDYFALEADIETASEAVKRYSDRFQLDLAQKELSVIPYTIQYYMQSFNYRDIYVITVNDGKPDHYLCKGSMVNDENIGKFKETGFGDVFDYSPKKHPGIKALLDGSKLKALGWKPLYSIETGLPRTVSILKELSTFIAK